MSKNPTTAANVNAQAAEALVEAPVETNAAPAALAPSEKPADATAAPTLAPSIPEPPARKSRWRRNLMMLIVPLALIGGGAWVWATGGRFEETDNAYLKQARVSMVSEVSGRISKVNIVENQAVKKGDLLFEIDQQPYKIALAQADAAVAQAQLGVEQLRAAYSQAVAGQKVAGDEVAFLQSELDRQSTLTKSGIGTGAALDSARADLKKAQGALTSAQQAVVGAVAALDGNPDIKTDDHPTVQAAIAARDKAAYSFDQTRIYAPGDGVVYQASSLKPGQFVAVGTALFALVETSDVWIDANFKETQLTHMKVGQEAEIALDAFPDRKLKAVVDSIGAGTGAEFSILPAQNATGNWVKVTQRLPVRLKVLTPDADMLLRTGLSADVTVDTGKVRGWGSIEQALAGWL